MGAFRLRLTKTELPQPFFQRGELGVGCDFGNHIDIQRWADRSCPGICDQ